MYGFDYGYEPASEGIGNFFSMVMDKIRAAGEKIKEWASKVALKLKRMTGLTSKEQSVKDSSEATADITAIKDGVTAILNGCIAEFNTLFEGYKKVGKYTEVSKTVTTTSDSIVDSNGNPATSTSTEKSKDYSESFKARGGMDRIRDDAKNNSELMDEWKKTKRDVGEKLAKQEGEATKIQEKLKKLASYGPLGITATKNGYASLRAIFTANGDVGNKWKQIKIVAEWSTGFIRDSLNKVIAMYDVGIRATDAFGRRLTSGFFREDNGDKMKKEDRKGEMRTAKTLNKVYKSDDNRNISVNRKDEKFLNKMGVEESALLDRLYAMAYEDAVANIDAANEAYDSTPGYYTFADECDDDYAYAYDVDYDF